MNAEILQKLSSFLPNIDKVAPNALVEGMSHIIEYLKEKVAICEEVIAEKTEYKKIPLSDNQKR